MEKQQELTDRIESAAAHTRLLADFVLTGPALQEIDRGALGRVLHDLADRLKQAAQDMEARP